MDAPPLKVNLAQLIGGKYKCLYLWRGKQSDCKFFEPSNKTGGEGDRGGCRWMKKASMGDPTPECTRQPAKQSNDWQSVRGGRQNHSHPKVLRRNRPGTPTINS